MQIVGGNGSLNTNKKVRLQLFCPPKLRTRRSTVPEVSMFQFNIGNRPALSRFQTPFWRVGVMARNKSICMEIRPGFFFGGGGGACG